MRTANIRFTMKPRTMIIILSVISFPAFFSCKTTEANYRQAYEAASHKQAQEGDSAITAGLYNQSRPKDMVFGNVTLPVITTGIKITKDGGMELSRLKRFNTVAGTFRQIFNASSMRERLVKSGYPEAFILQNAYGTYYVLTSTTDSAEEAYENMERLRGDKSLRLRNPLPYILRPGHLSGR